MYTFVVIGCERDIALLEFQAQSFEKYLTPGQEILLLVNEKEPAKFFNGFKNIHHYYDQFNLTIKTLADFDFIGGQPYVDQQILKLAAAELTENHLLVLDCQNFLFRPYVELPILDDKIPYREGPYSMDTTIWTEYCKSLGVDLPLGIHDMSLCTPMYLSKDIINSMIVSLGGLSQFAKWFYTATRLKSEFALYLIWSSSKLRDTRKYHYLETSPFTWAGPYLRDHPNFDLEFENYLKGLSERIEYKGHKKSTMVVREEIPKCCWSSINHRAWADMTDWQFNQLTTLLEDVKLDTKCMVNYRKFPV